MELRELFESKLILITEKTSLPKYAIGKLSYSFANGNGEKNLNARIYSEPLLQREIAKKNEEIKSSGILGQLDHPVGGETKLGKAMHILSNLSYEKTSKLANAESLILDTTAGRDFMTILKTGTKLGASMRGWGNVSDKGIVKDDWSLSSIDFVLNPSYGDIAQIDSSNLIESFNPESKKVEKVKKTKIKIDEKNIMAALKVCYDGEVAEYGLNESFEQYKKKKLTFVTAQWLLQNYPARFKNKTEALQYLVGTVAAGELDKKYAEEDEEIITNYEPTKQLAAEAFMMGITLDEYVKKLNETVGLPKADIPAREAQESGLAGETRLVEKMMEYPDGEKRIAYVSEKVDVHERIVEARKIKLFSTEEEELAKEAQRIFRIEKATNPKTTETIETIIQMLKAEKKRVQEEKEIFKKNRLAEQIKQSVAAGKAGELREELKEYKE